MITPKINSTPHQPKNVKCSSEAAQLRCYPTPSSISGTTTQSHLEAHYHNAIYMLSPRNLIMN